MANAIQQFAELPHFHCFCCVNPKLFGVLQAIIKLPFLLGGIKQSKCKVILRKFPLNGAWKMGMFGVGDAPLHISRVISRIIAPVTPL